MINTDKYAIFNYVDEWLNSDFFIIMGLPEAGNCSKIVINHYRQVYICLLINNYCLDKDNNN